MTERQLQLFEALWKRRNNPIGASFQEMAAEVGLTSRESITRLLKGLEEQGYIRRTRRRARSVELTGKVPPGFQLAQVHEMWVYETDRRDMPGVRIFQALSLCFFRSQLAERLLVDPTTNPIPRRVRVTIEEID